jgi:prophage tail gpP-like protein
MKTLIATLLMVTAGAAVACPDGDKSASAAKPDAKPAPVVAKADQARTAERPKIVTVSQTDAKATAQKPTRQ